MKAPVAPEASGCPPLDCSRERVFALQDEITRLEEALNALRLVRPAAARPGPGPAGTPERLWLVIQPGGTRHYLDKESEAEIREWAKGVDVTILEYRFAGVAHRPPPKPIAPR